MEPVAKTLSISEAPAFALAVQQQKVGHQTSSMYRFALLEETFDVASKRKAAKPSKDDAPKSKLHKVKTPGESPGKTTVGQKILAVATKVKGTKYVWGGGSCKVPPGGGYDCSGLVAYAVCKVTKRNHFKEGLRVTYSMYCAPSSLGKFNDSRDRMLHAPNPSTVVKEG
ncbi:hypothetical protein PAAG_12173 [Paracoccidioides lutzii Pb01]|uniref:NlpC/P60 domain-containing protein n=1 Tax=Paracoccidioides lutzii (strain ATCC MYA-826 / Pb01) TaxID=502779 RepID=A0A0A2V4U0_PARBA|nr:hypothetical protein PAAG_12173 [Paracoccidioides lutzii Pb01]KGQ01135.1 hypothetical protein PAAG_12173 [Paracoccidioides lutzii Pb01]